MEFAKIRFSGHAIRRMFERKIRRDDVVSAIRHGETVEEYSDDKPFPSRLVLHKSGTRSIHVVYGADVANDCAVVITVYEPDSTRWHEDFKRRR